MGFRFFKRMKILPGVSLNLSKSGPSLTVGPKGLKLTVGSKGVRKTVSIPGTGVYYTTQSSFKKKKAAAKTAAKTEAKSETLEPGFFQRLLMSGDDKEFLDGLKALSEGNEARAMASLAKADDNPDACLLHGFLLLKQGSFAEAEKALMKAEKQSGELGGSAEKYGVRADLALEVTDILTAHLGFAEDAVLLGLVEAYQGQDKIDEALQVLARLEKMAPDDSVIRLSKAELLLDAKPDDQAAAREAVRLAEGAQNNSAVNAALLYYKALALITLGLPEAAGDILAAVARVKSGRPPELILAARYARAVLLDESGEAARARKEFEKIYAELPDYEDVAQRLGLK